MLLHRKNNDYHQREAHVFHFPFGRSADPIHLANSMKKSQPHAVGHSLQRENQIFITINSTLINYFHQWKHCYWVRRLAQLIH